MDLKKMFGMKKRQDIPEQITDFAEIPEMVENKDHIKVVIEKLDSYVDTDRIVKKAMSGNIVIA